MGLTSWDAIATLAVLVALLLAPVALSIVVYVRTVDPPSLDAS